MAELVHPTEYRLPRNNISEPKTAIEECRLSVSTPKHLFDTALCPTDGGLRGARPLFMPNTGSNKGNLGEFFSSHLGRVDIQRAARTPVNRRGLGGTPRDAETQAIGRVSSRSLQLSAVEWPTKAWCQANLIFFFFVS